MLHSPLLELPPELLERIAKFLPRQDLRPFRATCKRLDQSTFGVFKEAYFTEVCYMLAYEDSLETLRQISKHPIFSRSIKKIHFSHMYVPPGWKESWEMVPPVQQFHLRPLFWEIVQNHKRLVFQQQEFQKGPDFECLKEIFSNFMLVGNVPAIAWSVHEEDMRPWGLNRLSWMLGDEWCVFLGGDEYERFNVLSNATLASTIQLKHLEIGDFYTSFPISRFNHWSSTHLVNTLRTLRLHVAPDKEYETSLDIEKQHFDMEELFIFISECRQVDDFGFALDDGNSRPRNSRMFKSLTWPAFNNNHPVSVLAHLRRLELDHHWISRGRLQEFLRERRSTLEVVKLRFIRDNGGDFGDLMWDLWDAADGNNKRDFVLDLYRSYGGPNTVWTISASETRIV